jgi:hypothetical protein
MRTIAALCLLALAAANCPRNSKQVAFPYKDMTSCKCSAGYKAYAFPGVGCFKQNNAYKCPTNAGRREGVTDAKQFSDCKCKDGFVPNKGKCVYGNESYIDM